MIALTKIKKINSIGRAASTSRTIPTPTNEPLTSHTNVLLPSSAPNIDHSDSRNDQAVGVYIENNGYAFKQCTLLLRNLGSTLLSDSAKKNLSRKFLNVTSEMRECFGPMRSS